MTSAYVPYNGTAGWSGTDTSQQRALDNIHSGRELNNQQKALHLLKHMGKLGLTWKELAQETGWHHGTASGILSVLHRKTLPTLWARHQRIAVTYAKMGTTSGR